MMTSSMNLAAVNDDADLVNATLAGNRDAFERIVTRYQSLICSLTYNATGSLGQSEDLSQEIFITAWKHLGHLRQREKLRSWLCGIARNRINNFLRREGREPLREAAPLEEAAESHPSPEPLPVEHTISKEEAQILWQALERIPELYREPLILFYREQQSIEAVAASLELSEDTVKQRLSRGRKMLQEQVLAFVEGALSRTNPGKAFTSGVLAALPATMLTSAKAAATAAAAKGIGTAKAAGALGTLGWICAPLLSVFGNYLPYRASLEEARTGEERKNIKAFFRKVLWWTLGLSAVTFAVLGLGVRHDPSRPMKVTDLLMAGFVILTVSYLLALFVGAVMNARGQRRYYARVLAEEHQGVPPPAAFEYRTEAKFLGLPLVHIRVGDRFDILRKPVVAWIACGNHCIGGLLAFGGVAVAPFSLGALAFGLIPFGGIVAGLFPMGGLAFGAWAYGGVAVGWQAIGGFALAWDQATGGMALARHVATGAVAHGLQANTDAAEQAVAANWFFRIAIAVGHHWFWTNFLWVAPLFIQWRLIARARRRELGK